MAQRDESPPRLYWGCIMMAWRVERSHAEHHLHHASCIMQQQDTRDPKRVSGARATKSYQHLQRLQNHNQVEQMTPCGAAPIFKGDR